MKPSAADRFPHGLRRLRATCLAALLGALLAQPAAGMDLLQAYEAALSQDATVRAARAANEAAQERVPQARAQLLPSLSLSVGRNSNDLTRTSPNALGRPVTTEQDYFSYNQTLQLRQPLYRKPLLAGLDQARHLVDEADAMLERELQNLGVRVAGAYMEVLLAHDQVDLVLQQQKALLVQLDAARKALAAGAGIRTDIDEAQARLDLNRADELAARQQLEYSRRQLEVLVGQPIDSLAPVDAAKMPLLPPDPASLQAWLDMAQAASPEIQALEARAMAARLEVRKASGGHHPTLDAVAAYSRSGSENVTAPDTSYRSWVLGLQFNLPIYQGGYVSSQVRQALAEQTRAEELLEAARRELSVRLHNEYRGVTEGVLRVRALEEAVRSATQLVRSNTRAFEAGARTRVDILNAEQTLQVARRDLAQARYRYLVSRVNLKALAGSDRRAAIEELNAWLVQR